MSKSKTKLTIERRTRRNGHKYAVVARGRGPSQPCACGSDKPQRTCCGTVIRESSTLGKANDHLTKLRNGFRELPAAVLNG